MTERSLVPPSARARIKALAVPFAVGLGRAGLTPNALTIIGFLGTCSAAVLAGLQLWLAAGIVSLAFAAFDMLDGALARATGRVSKFGAFLDSTLDRAGESAVYVGIVWGASVSGQPALAVASAATLVVAFLVSYTRARAEGLGYGGDVGIAPRPERVVVMGVGLIATGLGGGIAETAASPSSITATTVVDTSGIQFTNVGGSPWLAAALGILFVVSLVTVLQRILHVRDQAARADG